MGILCAFALLAEIGPAFQLFASSEEFKKQVSPEQQTPAAFLAVLPLEVPFIDKASRLIFGTRKAVGLVASKCFCIEESLMKAVSQVS